jgi:phosphatidylglycerophosphate synthase
MKRHLSREAIEILSTISKGRHRTNILKSPEQRTLAFLVKRIPPSINSDMLTFLGLLGSLTTALSFILAAYINRNFLLLGILGFGINWFGDSLDGRLAYYRNKPRKWYGFSLDITVDWITIILIGAGYVIYADGFAKGFGIGFVVMYGWAMITTLLQFKITDKYSIDTGIFGPTEVRVIISLILIAEVLFKDSIIYTVGFACAVLLIVNIISTLELLKEADNRDNAEKEQKLKEKNI